MKESVSLRNGNSTHRRRRVTWFRSPSCNHSYDTSLRDTLDVEAVASVRLDDETFKRLVDKDYTIIDQT